MAEHSKCLHHIHIIFYHHMNFDSLLRSIISYVNISQHGLYAWYISYHFNLSWFMIYINIYIYMVHIIQYLFIMGFHNFIASWFISGSYLVYICFIYVSYMVNTIMLILCLSMWLTHAPRAGEPLVAADRCGPELRPHRNARRSAPLVGRVLLGGLAPLHGWGPPLATAPAGCIATGYGKWWVNVNHKLG